MTSAPRITTHAIPDLLLAIEHYRKIAYFPGEKQREIDGAEADCRLLAEAVHELGALRAAADASVGPANGRSEDESVGPANGRSKAAPPAAAQSAAPPSSPEPRRDAPDSPFIALSRRDVAALRADIGELLELDLVIEGLTDLCAALDFGVTDQRVQQAISDLIDCRREACARLDERLRLLDVALDVAVSHSAPPHPES